MATNKNIRLELTNVFDQPNYVAIKVCSVLEMLHLAKRFDLSFQQCGEI